MESLGSIGVISVECDSPSPDAGSVFLAGRIAFSSDERREKGFKKKRKNKQNKT